jgi:hypothetical protein
MTSFVFNPFISNFDSVISVGSVVPSAMANTVAYFNGSKVLSSSTGFEYYDTLPGGTGLAEYGLGLTRTLARTVDISTVSTALLQATLTNTDTFIASGNDGSSAFYASNYTLLVGGSANLNTDVVQLSYIGFSGTLNNSGIQTLRGSTDFGVSYIGAQGVVNMSSISVPTDAGDIGIRLYGGIFTASAQINVVAPANPTQTVYGVYATASKGGAMVPNACYGAWLRGSLGTLNYGAYVEGTTAGLYTKGHILPFTTNTYDIGESATIMRTGYFKKLDLTTATTSSDGVFIGGAKFYQDTATSGSGGTLVNPRVRYASGNLLVAGATHTSTSAGEFALQATKTFTPAANTSGRCWGFNFSVNATSAFNFTDATSSIVGVEGSTSNNSTGTMAAMSGGIFFNTLGANSTTTRFCGIDIYGADVSGSGGVGATVTEGAGLLVRMGRSSGNTSLGNIVDWWGVQLRASTWSGTGHMTGQIGVGYASGGTMNAITANNQLRRMFVVPAMPDPGAFTGTTIYGIDFLGTSRLSRDGIRFAGDVELFSGASNRLDVGSGDSIRSDTALISPLHRPGLTSGGSTQAMTVRGRDTGDDLAIGGAGTNLTVRAGDGATAKPTGAGGNLIFRCANGSTTGVMTFYKVDGTTKLQEFSNTGVAWFAKTPIAQPTTASGAAAFVANTSGIANDTATFGGYTIGQIAKALVDYGLLN